MDGMTHLIKILDSLTDISNFSSDYAQQNHIADCAYGFREIYTQKFRHSYSILSAYLENFDGEQRDMLVSNLEDVLKEIDNSDWSDADREQVHESVFKLQDHISLESIRLNRMDQIKRYDEESKRKLKSSSTDLKETKRQINRIVRQVNSVNAQVISILGIFAGLVFGFSSGVELMGKSFSTLDAKTFTITLLYIFSIGLILFNLCFLLMFCTAKMSNQSIATKCKSIECTECKEKCSFIKRGFKKYPYVLCFNLLDVLFLIALFVLTTTNVLS